MKRTILLLVLLFVGTLPTLACEPVIADIYYTIGDEVRIGDAVAQVHEIHYGKTRFGDAVIVVEVSIRNVGEVMFKVNDQWDVNLYDQDGFKLRRAIFTGRGDGLTTDIRPGRTIRSDIAFHPEDDSNEYLFSYLYRYSEGLNYKGEVPFYLGSPNMTNTDRRAYVDTHNERFGY